MTVLEFRIKKLAEYAMPLHSFVTRHKDLILSDDEWSKLEELTELIYFPGRFLEACKSEKDKFRRCLNSLKYFYKLFKLRYEHEED
jgi:hypothetical protein